MKLPDPTMRNALVTPLLLIRAPLILLGQALEWSGRTLQEVAGFIPAWTDYQRRKW